MTYSDGTATDYADTSATGATSREIAIFGREFRGDGK